MRTLKTLIAALLLTTTATGAHALGMPMKPGDPLFPLGPSTVCSNKGDILAAVFYASHNHLEQAIKAKRISCAITSSAEGKVLYFDGDVIKAKFKRGPYKIGYVYAGDWFDGTGD